MIKGFKKEGLLKLGIFIIMTFFIFGAAISVYIRTDRELSDATGKMIRLHVVANSDSPEDQALKLSVRDAIIRTMSPKFEGLDSIEEAKEVIDENLGEIERLASETLAEQGRRYEVAASLERCDFPTKAYGSLTLPAGTYQALNVVIGEGEGKNWWCVMFPPLCFIDIAQGVVSEDTMKELKEILTEDEYRLLTSAKAEEGVPVKLRFKIVEMARSFNQRLAQIGKGK